MLGLSEPPESAGGQHATL